jgi:hypothetical protein
MDIQFEKLELIKMLAETNDSDIISAIKNIFVKKRNDFWEKLYWENIKLKTENILTLKNLFKNIFDEKGNNFR